MRAIETLGLALGASFAAGLNVYATVAVLGLLHRFDVVSLPAALEILGEPVVLGVALALYAVEFLADKIPYVDSVWDAIHTFIRPPAAAVLAYGALGNVPEAWRVAAGLLAGSIALSSHGAKATTRAAVNASPEPFSNWALSLGEDLVSVALAWFAASHPLLALAVVAVLVALSIFLMVKLFRFARRAFGWLLGDPDAPASSAAGLGGRPQL
jgi:hypothetical protein